MKGGEPIQINGRAGQRVHVKLERTRANKAITRKTREFKERKTIR